MWANSTGFSETNWENYEEGLRKQSDCQRWSELQIVITATYIDMVSSPLFSLPEERWVFNAAIVYSVNHGELSGSYIWRDMPRITLRQKFAAEALLKGYSWFCLVLMAHKILCEFSDREYGYEGKTNLGISSGALWILIQVTFSQFSSLKINKAPSLMGKQSLSHRRGDSHHSMH